MNPEYQKPEELQTKEFIERIMAQQRQPHPSQVEPTLDDVLGPVNYQTLPEVKEFWESR